MRRPSGTRLLLLGLLAAGLLGTLGGVTYAAFSSATANPASSFTAKRIYPGDRDAAAWDVRDSSAFGFEFNASNVFGFAADNRTRTTKNWPNAYAPGRYQDFDLNAALPPGLAVSSASFDFRISSSSGTQTSCYYFEVRRISTGAVLATHGGTGADVACVTGTTYVTTSTPIPSVSTTDIANDLRIRVLLRNSGAGPTRIDQATVATATPFGSATLYPVRDADAADGNPVSVVWGPPSGGDGAVYQSVTTWPAAFAANEFLKFTFPGYVPAGATLNSASFRHSYRSTAAGTVCHYFEVWVAGAVIGTHGSAAAPYSCHNNTGTFLTETVALPEIDTVAEANGAMVKMFVRHSGSGNSQHDLASLRVNYHLD
jgi:hypothetical protein